MSGPVNKLRAVGVVPQFLHGCLVIVDATRSSSPMPAGGDMMQQLRAGRAMVADGADVAHSVARASESRSHRRPGCGHKMAEFVPSRLLHQGIVQTS